MDLRSGAMRKGRINRAVAAAVQRCSHSQFTKLPRWRAPGTIRPWQSGSATLRRAATVAGMRALAETVAPFSRADRSSLARMGNIGTNPWFFVALTFG